jgi:hypothetical protein
MMNVAVVILNYNSASDCRKCIGFLKKQEGVGAEIIVVDNCSPREGEQESIRSLCEELHCTFIPATENRGYNAGNNIGLRYAAEKGYKYALIANPDMEFPQTDYLKKMVEVMERDDSVAVCGSNILSPEGNRQNPWKFSSLWEEFSLVIFFRKMMGLRRECLPDISGYCDLVHGCCMMVNLRDVASMNFLDENVFLFCEEVILGKSIYRINKRIYYCKETYAIHRHIDSKKGSFVQRYKIFWVSRSYYLKEYSNCNKYVLILLNIDRSLRYYFDLLLFRLKGIR